ncbi:MAG: zinc-ribbon domain-containing protein [Myxococcaceae bacterium]|nr:zinc-ribbon domain-containing protein [Myxococcaceae bacterium]
MIVKCEQCQTRFKIPDDKVTEKGVKVRCTKCQHTFRVKKEGDAAAPAAAAPGAPDPFAKFGAPPPMEPGEETRPHMYSANDLSPLAPSFAAQADLPPEAFDSPIRVGPMPQPPPGKRPLTDPSPFDFAALGPPAAAPPPPSKPFEPAPFDFAALSPPEPPKKTELAKVKLVSRPAPQAFEPQPFDFGSLGGDAPPAPTQREPARPHTPAPSAFDPQPFDFSSLDAQAPAAPPAPPPAPKHSPPSNFDPQPFDFSSLETKGPPAPPPPPSRPPPSAPKPAAKPPPAPAMPAFDLGPSMELSAPPPPPPARAKPPPPAAPEPRDGGLLGDIPVDAGALSADVDGGLEASPEQRGSLFDMPAVSEPTDNQLSAPAPDEGVAVAKIALKKVTADELKKAPAADAKEASSRRPKRGVVAMVWNVVSGFVLLGLLGVLITVVLNEGKVDAALSWSKVKALFSKPRELVAFDISNGLYDTRVGRPVFYVRGEVKNRGARAGRVKVKAEILDGEDLVRSAEGWVGATPSPEDLYGVATADDLAKLSTRLAPNAAKLDPGAAGPFLVAFYEYPPDLKDFRVRVTVSTDEGTTAAR